MKRTELLEILQNVGNALSRHDFVEVFSCFYFDGEKVSASDEIVAIEAPCELDARGAVKGQLLLGLLNASLTKEVEVEQADEELRIKSGRSRQRLALIPEDAWIDPFPEDAGENAVDMPEGFLAAIARCSKTMGHDSTQPATAGITIAFGKKETHFYSTDGPNASEAVLAGKVAARTKEVVLSPRFCLLLLKLANRDKPTTIEITEKWTEVRFKGGMRLYGVNIATVEVERYQAVFGDELTDGVEFVPVPKALSRAIERASIVGGDSTPTAFSVQGGKLILNTVGKGSSVKDSMKLSPEHEDSTLTAVAADVSKGLVYGDVMAVVDDQWIVFRQQDTEGLSQYTQIAVAVAGAEEPNEE